MGIANKIKSNQDKDGMLRRSLERLIQLYTDKSHFVYELLQNAEDAEAHCISFKQYEDRLEVMHDGIPFTEENLQGLCDIGKSDKVDNLNQIGEFGVGFKSVFGICDTVQLFSCPRKNGTGYNAFAVEIQDFTNPVDIELAEIPSPFTTKFVFPYKVGLPFSGFKTVERLNEVLSERLSDLGFTTLLFMKNLKLIEYEICINGKEQQGKYKLNKKQFDYNCTLVSAIDENDEDNKSENEQCFVVFSKAVNSNTPNRTVDIAFAATKDKNEKLIFQKADNPYISVYFPTETESKLDLIVQGPFRTTPNRSSVPADDESNKALALVVAQLLVESVRSLKKMGYMSVDLLNILPLKHEQFNVYSLFSPLFDSLKTLFISEPILPTNLKNVYVKASNALIARNNEMIELFPDNVISDLIKEYRQYEWIPEAVKETGPYSNVHAYLTKVLKIRSLRPEDLRKYFKSNPNFLKGQSKEWLVKMYKLFSLVPGVFAEETRVNNMLDTPFIMTKSGKIVAPYRKSDGKYIPNVFLPIQSYEYDFELVDPYLFGQCRDFFLHTLRLKQPDEYSLLVKSLEKRYAYRYYNGQIDEHIRDVKLILKYLNDATRCILS